MCIADLIQRDMLNEERFAQAYARGKFRVNRWGRLKIRRMLQTKNISAFCIQSALSEIDDAQYIEQLERLAAAYMHKHRSMDAFTLRQRTAHYLMGKGYEGDLVWEAINGYDT